MLKQKREMLSMKPESTKDYSTWLLLLQARDGLFKIRQKELSQYDISPEQAAVLFIVQAIGHSPTPTEIARWLLREPHSVCALLNRMERKGLVTRAKNSARKNLVRVALTEKGRQVYSQSASIKSIRRIMSCLSEEEHQQLDSCLYRLRAVELKELGVKCNLPFLQSLEKSNN